MWRVLFISSVSELKKLAKLQRKVLYSAIFLVNSSSLLYCRRRFCKLHAFVKGEIRDRRYSSLEMPTSRSKKRGNVYSESIPKCEANITEPIGADEKSTC